MKCIFAKAHQEIINIVIIFLNGFPQNQFSLLLPETLLQVLFLNCLQNQYVTFENRLCIIMLCPFLVGFKHKCICIKKMLCSLMDLLLRSNNMKTSNKPICKIISEGNNASLHALNKMFCLIAYDLKYINSLL